MKKSPSCARIDRLKPAPPRALWADHPHTRIIKGNLESWELTTVALKTRERRAAGRLPIGRRMASCPHTRRCGFNEPGACDGIFS